MAIAQAQICTLNDLSRKIKGDIITSSSTEYEIIRQQYDLSLSRHPSAIVRCKAHKDVALALQYVLDNDLEFAVRSGAHSIAGYSTCDDCILIDLRLLNKIKINENQQDPTVSADVGLRINELFYALEYNSKSGKKYWLPAGVENVGLGGHIHGGGWGIGTRKYGLTIDNLVEAKVITVNHKKQVQTKRASMSENSDLFYCIRGTIGPSCGIVVQWKLRIYEQNPLYTLSNMNAIGITSSFYPQLDELIVVNQSVSDENEDYFAITYHQQIVYESSPIISAATFVFYDGDVITKESNFAQNVMSQIPNIGGILINYRTFNGSYLYIRCIQNRLRYQSDVKLCDDNEYLKIFGEEPIGHQATSWLYDTKQEYDEFIEGNGYSLMINEISNNCPFSGLLCGYYMSTWGGKMNEYESDLTAFPWRNTKFDIAIFQYFSVQNPLIIDNALNDSINWQINLFLDNLYPNGLTTERGYDNYLIPYFEDEEDYLPYYYGDNIDKIIYSKCKWDSMNIFTNPQGIPVDHCYDSPIF